MKVQLEKIPQELRAHKGWLLWRYEDRKGKQTKVPYRADSPQTPALSTDPATWSTFEAAVAAYQGGNVDGIGIVPPEDITIVDLDHAGDGLWAKRIRERLASYTEFSPSGKGLHIFVRGRLTRARRVGCIELYPGGGGRFVTVTGRHVLDSPSAVRPAQEALDELAADVDFYRDFLAWARRGGRGEKAERLMAGDATSYPSPSEADLALADLLMLWAGGDRKRALRVLRLSGLWDEKWERPNYVGLTFEKAASLLAVERNGDLHDRILPKALIVDESKKVVAIQAEITLKGGDPKVHTIPVKAITATNLPEAFQEALGFTWPPEQARVIQRILADATRSQTIERREIVSRPGWRDSRLLLPEDFPPPRGAAAAARAAWSEIVRTALHHSKVLVTLGAAAASPLLERWGLKTFIVHLTGDSRTGKTRTIKVAVSIFGDPAHLLRTWNSTRVGLIERLSAAGVIPVALDELAAGNLRDEDLETVIFGATAGVARGRAKREGGLQREAPPWTLVVLSSGERKLTSSTGLTGARARVLELWSPMTPDADTIDRLHDLAVAHAGWPLQWMRESDFTPRAPTPLPCDGSPVLRTLAGYVAAAAEGFLELARWVGVDVQAAVVRSAAETVLAETTVRLEAEGPRAADRLYEAVLEDFARNSFAYPGSKKTPGKPSWWMIEEIPNTPVRGMVEEGLLYVFPSVVQKVAEDIGIGDPETALRGLRDDGRLVPEGRRLKKRTRAFGDRTWMYAFRLPEEEEEITDD
jgi:putative DNA primase/helicase